MVKEGCLYLCSTKNNKRSDNAFAQLLDGAYIIIVYFVLDPESKQAFVMRYKLRTQPVFREHYKMLKTVIFTSENKAAVISANISRVCLNFTIHDKEYICAVPNLCSY